MRIALSTSSSRLPSFTLAAVTMSDNGTPRPSTRRWRLLPFFSPIRRVRPDGFLRQRGLHQCAVNTLPSPRDALQVVVLGKAGLPQLLKEAGLLPLEEALVNGAGAAEALLGQRLPLAPRAQHVHHRLKDLSCRLGRAPCAGLADIGPDLLGHARRNQRLHTLPELISHHPRFDSLGHGLAPTPRVGAARSDSVSNLRISSKPRPATAS